MTKRKFTDLLGDRAFWRTTARLAIPIALQNLLISSFALVDTVMVSQLGGVELSATGMAGQWVWLLNIFLFGAASGGAVFISQYWGVNDRKGIHRVMGISFLVVAVFLLPFFLIPLISPTLVLSFFTKEAEVVAVGSRYIAIALWSYPAIAINSVVSNVLRSTEHVKLPMAVSFVTTVLNGVLNACLIFGLGPFPQMGVEGAAVATVVSAWAGPVLLIVISLLQKNILRASPRDVFCIPKSECRAFFKRSAPAAFNEILWGAGTLVINLIYSNISAEMFGGVTILRSVENIAFAFIQGLGAACCVLVGKTVGSGQIREAIRDARRFGILVPLFSVVLGVSVILARPLLIALFNFSGTLSELTLETAYGVLLIYGLEIAMRNIPYIQVVGIYRSGGDTFTAAIFDIGCLWLLSIPATALAAYLGAPFLLVFAITYMVEDWPKCVCCLIHFRRGGWIKPVTEEGRAGLEAYRAELAAK